MVAVLVKVILKLTEPRPKQTLFLLLAQCEAAIEILERKMQVIWWSCRL